MAIVVDTSIFLSIFYEERSRQWSENVLLQKDRKISTITIAEILASVYKKSPPLAMVAKSLVEQVILPENIIPVAIDVAEVAGKMKAKYGPNFSMADSVILATALLTGCDSIATLDPEFDKISEIKIVRL